MRQRKEKQKNPQEINPVGFDIRTSCPNESGHADNVPFLVSDGVGVPRCGGHDIRPFGGGRNQAGHDINRALLWIGKVGNLPETQIRNAIPVERGVAGADPRHDPAWRECGPAVKTDGVGGQVYELHGFNPF